MNTDNLDIVIIGLSLSSSWGNGHATTYRSLIKGLHKEGHKVTFLEQNVPWYASNRDLTSSPHCRLRFYEGPEELKRDHADTIGDADLVIVGSYVQQGVAVGEWVTSLASGITAFYDIDTPVTLTKLDKGDYEYITPKLIPEYDLYLSFSGGKALKRLTEVYNAPAARPLYCSVDPDLYYPDPQPVKWQMGYLGTYSDDRQPGLNRLLLDVAEKQPEKSFVVAGPQYPSDISWPGNVERIEHLPPREHRRFYNQQRFTLNITRDAMVESGFSPSVRLFEAAACATPIISDHWEGLETLFRPDEEIFIARSSNEVHKFLKDTSEEDRQHMGQRACERVLEEHSSRERARQLIHYVRELKVWPSEPADNTVTASS